MTSSSSAGIAWRFLAGFSIWAATFVALYALNAIGCAAGWDRTGAEPFTAQRAMLLAVAVVGLAGTIAVLRRAIARPRPDGDDFFGATTRLLALSATGAMILMLLPPLALSTCV